MKRYLIFAALVPLFGGFLLLLATTVMSGYWSNHPGAAEVENLLAVFVTTLLYSYLFGILPALMIGAVDDILVHFKRIGWVVRVVIVGAIAFTATELLYGSRGPDSGALQFVLYGLVGFVPATISSWLAHRMVEQQPLPASRPA
jgi:UDP-N-acetylmuramyl pentapeptide phosphotransferase/UDP-N-acetylglucosamine-1-phosphate transferase